MVVCRWAEAHRLPLGHPFVPAPQWPADCHLVAQVLLVHSSVPKGDSPVPQVHSPVPQVHFPVPQVHFPVAQVHSPTSKADSQASVHPQVAFTLVSAVALPVMEHQEAAPEAALAAAEAVLSLVCQVKVT